MKFRKKPVVIEAMQWDGSEKAAASIMNWISTADGVVTWRKEMLELRAPNGELSQLAAPTHLRIRTLEGTMMALTGDWIIKGVKGEFYPCKPDIFEATYERVEE